MSKNKRELRVLFICDFAASFPGSFIESLYLLGEYLKKNGGKLWYIFPQDKYYLEPLKEHGSVNIVPSFQGKKFDQELYISAKTLVKSEKIQVIHTNFGLCGYITACIISHKFNIVHIAHERSLSKNFVFGKKPVRRFLTQLLFKYLNFISKTYHIAISSAVRDSLIHYNGINTKKIVVIPNAVRIDRSKYTYDLHSKEYLNKVLHRNVIGMVSNFGRAKDHLSVFRAISIVKQKWPSSIFVFIGGNIANNTIDSRAAYETLVAEMNLQNYVFFSGERSDPYPYIEMFKIGILISHFEGFGNALVEYMLRKKPVIGTSVGGIKDIIIDGENGFLVPARRPDILAEKIIWLLDNPSKAEEMGERGFLRAQKEYSMDVWIKRIWEMYNSALLKTC